MKSFASSAFAAVIVALAALMLQSCTKEERAYVKAITVSPVSGNALRVNVDITFSGQCDYSITYWNKDTPDQTLTTNVYSSEGTNATTELMFMYASSTYQFRVNIEDGSGKHTDNFEFTTSALPAGMPEFTVTEGAGYKIPGYYFTTHWSEKYLFITDTDGKLVWYQKLDVEPRQFDLQFEDNRIWLNCGYLEASQGDFQRLNKYVLCLDLHGNEISRWDLSKNELGIPYIHHEIRQTPDGNVAVVCNQVKKFDLTPIGGQNDTDIWGDGYAIFDKDGKVLKSWDTFGEIDPLTCTYVTPLVTGIDLVHANSVNWDSKGYIYMTFNRINQLWKIDPSSGKVLYRAGRNGNVDIASTGLPNGMHAAVPLEEDKVLFLNNGKGKKVTRAMIYKIDPAAMTGTVEMDVALPTEYFASDRSNVELICDGTMLMFGLTSPGYVVFTDLQGTILKAIHRDGLSYRAHYIPELPKY